MPFVQTLVCPECNEEIELEEFEDCECPECGASGDWSYDENHRPSFYWDTDEEDDTFD